MDGRSLAERYSYVVELTSISRALTPAEHLHLTITSYHLRSAYIDSSTFRFNDKVSVVAFHWDNDNINAVPLQTEPLGVFRDHYRFGNSSFTFPVSADADSHMALLRHLFASNYITVSSY